MVGYQVERRTDARHDYVDRLKVADERPQLRCRVLQVKDVQLGLQAGGSLDRDDQEPPVLRHLGRRHPVGFARRGEDNLVGVLWRPDPVKQDPRRCVGFEILSAG
jgi:hypothetical protein